MRSLTIAVVLLALLATLVACAAPSPAADAVQAAIPAADAPPPTPAGEDEVERLRVIATTTIVADVVANVARDRADIYTLLPVGADTHAFEPAPRDLTLLRDADVIIAIGAGLEDFLEAFIASAGEGVPVVYLSEGIDLREFAHPEYDHKDEAHADDAHADDAHDHEGVDPHTWKSPVNVMVFARNTAEALASLDPASAEIYRANAEAYVAELEELDRWVQAQIATIPKENRLLVTDHDAFGYYADRYGLQQIGAIIPSFSTVAQPSARELAALETAMREYGVRAVFVGTTVNPALAERVAEDLGIELVVLYTESLGEPGSGAETYIDYIRYNTNAIVEALR